MRTAITILAAACLCACATPTTLQLGVSQQDNAQQDSEKLAEQIRGHQKIIEQETQ